MASTRTTSRIKSLIVCALVAAAAIVALPRSASAVPDPPTAADLTAQLDKLAEQTEMLTEQYNGARIEVERQTRAVDAAQHAAATAQANFESRRTDLVEIAAARYMGGAFSRTGAILDSDSGKSYLDTLESEDMLARHTAGVVAQLNQARATAQSAREHARKLLAEARRMQEALAAKREKISAQTSRIETMLVTLTAPQRQAYTTRNVPSQAQVQAAYTVRAGNAAAQQAVQFALAQVGKPYVWAAAGPDAFDCSGLTMAAWAHGGVSLPHFAAAQFNFGQKVGYDEMQPGDLIFLYADLHHVMIYIGNGMAVSAPQTGENVKIVRVADSRSEFVGATRLS